MRRLLYTALLSLALLGAALGDGVYVDDNGTLREIQRIFVNDSGTLREIQEGYVNDNGTLRRFFTGAQLLAGDGGLVSAIDVVAPFDSTVGIRFLANGSVQIGSSTDGVPIIWVDHGTWIDPTSEAGSGNFSVRYTNRVGTQDFTTKAANEDSWIAITTTRTWLVNSTFVGGAFFTVDFEVREDGGALATASEAYTFNISHN